MARKLLVPADIGGQKITSLALPTAATDAASKAYVDGKITCYRSIANVGTGASVAQVDLHTVTVAAGDLAVGSLLHVVAAANVTGVAGRRLVGLGTSSGLLVQADSNVAAVAGDYLLEAWFWVQSTAAAYWKAAITGLGVGEWGTGATFSGSLARDFTAAFNVTLRGQTLNAGDEITGRGLTVVGQAAA